MLKKKSTMTEKFYETITHSLYSIWKSVLALAPTKKPTFIILDDNLIKFSLLQIAVKPFFGIKFTHLDCKEFFARVCD